MHIQTSLNWVSIVSAIGLLPVWHQAITWTSVDLLSLEKKRMCKINIDEKFFI